MNNTYNKIIEIINKYDNFVITTHVNPDGDAIGSELALARLLKDLGKNVKIINHSATPDYLLFMLNYDKEILQFNPEEHLKLISNANVIFTLDLNSLNRTKSLENYIRESTAVKICIDHHEFPENFYSLSIIDTNSASTGELIYYLIKKFNLKLTYNYALPIYVAIVTDTGSFKYERTTPELHKIAAELLEAGVIPKEVHHNVYEQGSLNRIKLLGKTLNSLEVVGNNKIAYMVIRRKDLQETDSKEEDIEGFINYTLSIKDIEIGLLFFELKNGFKTSLRSSSKIPVNKLAAEFGGGGHFFAAGLRMNNINIDEGIKLIIPKAKEYLKKYL